MITIKGLREGLLIVLDGETWLTQLRELENKFSANANFFKGGQVALDVKGLQLNAEDVRRAQALLAHYEVVLWAVISQDVTTVRVVQSLGLPDSLAAARAPIKTNSRTQGQAPAPIAESEPEREQEPVAEAEEAGIAEGTDGLLVRRRVRSGQVLRHPGHIVVVGDVNPGAQLIAGGDIIVWGKLYGTAHAGALGDAGAMVCALDMAPSLLKIADATRAARTAERRSRSSRPEMALIEQQEIKFVSWQGR
jgi:septum site-determining protein MinC